jgi:hypothetical protein
MYAAWQARVEAAHGAHDVDAFEILRAILFEDRRVLHGVLIGPRRAIHIAGIRIPGGRRIGVIVGDLVIADYDVMRKNAPHRFMETAADRFFRHLEIVPGARASGM